MKTFVNRAVIQILDRIEEENPIHKISEKEAEEFISKLGSMVSIVKNKNISPTALFLAIISDPLYEDIFNKFAGTNTTLDISKILLLKYPNLLKSKLVKDSAIKIMKKRKAKEKSR